MAFWDEKNKIPVGNVKTKFDGMQSQRRLLRDGMPPQGGVLFWFLLELQVFGTS